MVDAPTSTGKPEVYFAEDILEFGPRGVHELEPVGIDAIRDYAELVGETNPLYLDVAFAEGTEFGSTIVPPMLLFCMGFSAFLRTCSASKCPRPARPDTSQTNGRFIAPFDKVNGYE